MAKVGHSRELQALRGLAALCVLLHHSLRVLGPVGVTGWMAEVPLNAHAAVVVFFVLSGFVLGRSLLQRGFAREELLGYYVRRAFRIYPALWLACTMGLFYFLFVRELPAPHMGLWTQRHYDPQAFSPATIVRSYLALTPFLDPPLWTILVELAASALLPAMVLLFVRAPRAVLPVIVLLAIASFYQTHSLRGVLTYLVDFAFGAMLAVRGTRGVPAGWRVWLAVVVLLFFRQLHGWSYDAALPGLIEGCAATIVIAGIVNGALPGLAHDWLRRLGDISYSLYLLHLPIAYTAAHLLDRHVLGRSLTEAGPLAVAAITLAVTLPLAALSYRYVELPGIALGRQLFGRWRAADPRAA